jgi:hypothetical protein
MEFVVLELAATLNKARRRTARSYRANLLRDQAELLAVRRKLRDSDADLENIIVIIQFIIRHSRLARVGEY